MLESICDNAMKIDLENLSLKNVNSILIEVKKSYSAYKLDYSFEGISFSF
jgi:hypothetical protein